MATNFIHGKSGSFAFGGTTFNVEQFSGKHTITTDDVTHSGAAGAYVPLAGIEKLEGDVTLVWDANAVPVSAPQNIKAGATGLLTLKPDGASIVSCQALITGDDFSSGPKAGAVRVKAQYVNSGAITYP